MKPVIKAALDWLMSEPGDRAADRQFEIAVVEAGLAECTSHIHDIECTGQDDYMVIVSFSPYPVKPVIINTRTGMVHREGADEQA